MCALGIRKENCELPVATPRVEDGQPGFAGRIEALRGDLTQRSLSWLGRVLPVQRPGFASTACCIASFHSEFALRNALNQRGGTERVDQDHGVQVNPDVNLWMSAKYRDRHLIYFQRKPQGDVSGLVGVALRCHALVQLDACHHGLQTDPLSVRSPRKDPSRGLASR